MLVSKLHPVREEWVQLLYFLKYKLVIAEKKHVKW